MRTEAFMAMPLPARAGEAEKRARPRHAHRLQRIHDLEDLEPAIRSRLPVAVYGYVAHGSESETTLRSNRAQFDEWRLLTRILVGVEHRSLQRELFGRRYAGPFGIAPMGGSALVAFDGHLVMARAAYKAGIPFILSANSIIPMEEVAAANPNAWFAAYQSPTPKAVEGMVDRVARAGISTLVLTADVPVGSNRENDARSGFSFPIRPSLRLSWDVLTHPRWMFGVLARTLLKRGIPHIVNLEPDGGPGLFSQEVKGIAAHESLSWDHFKLMRKLWKGPLIVKGILSPGTWRWRGITGLTESLPPIMAAASSIRRFHRCGPCPPWSGKARGSKSWSIAVFAAAPTSSRPMRWVPISSSWGALSYMPPCWPARPAFSMPSSFSPKRSIPISLCWDFTIQARSPRPSSPLRLPIRRADGAFR
jgi:isopentenyl diphosphate isomerase/L-lactate dehydrogenase-like FMN-dependent dehydrogenase